MGLFLVFGESLEDCILILTFGYAADMGVGQWYLKKKEDFEQPSENLIPLHKSRSYFMMSPVAPYKKSMPLGKSRSHFM